MKTEIQWCEVARELPDDETTVLLAFADGEVGFGYKDGEEWRDAIDDCCVDGEVTHWAHWPEHPARLVVK